MCGESPHFTIQIKSTRLWKLSVNVERGFYSRRRCMRVESKRNVESLVQTEYKRDRSFRRRFQWSKWLFIVSSSDFAKTWSIQFAPNKNTLRFSLRKCLVDDSYVWSLRLNKTAHRSNNKSCSWNTYSARGTCPSRKRNQSSASVPEQGTILSKKCILVCILTSGQINFQSSCLRLTSDSHVT